jgi:hypothetical protein
VTLGLIGDLLAMKLLGVSRLDLRDGVILYSRGAGQP